MAKIFSDRVITSIDIGTTKICVLVTQHLHEDHVEILGVGTAPSHGLKKGVVVDVGKTIQSIRTAVKEAELMAGFPIESAYIGISGGHIASRNSTGVVPIKRGEVTHFDIENVLAAAQAVPIPEGQQILHVLPQYFVIDGQEKVRNPRGMHGVRLETEVHMILGAIASVQNLIKCCESAGVKVNDIILEQLASAEAVLSDDERELGIAVLDIGGGTSDLAIYQHGNIRHTFVLPVAGNHFTNDIAVGLKTKLLEAERVKKEYGIASIDILDEDGLFEVDNLEGTEKKIVTLSELVYIIQPRSEELFAKVRDELIKHKLYSCMTAGLVLTGGGSLLCGIKELAERIFRIPVRIGTTCIKYDVPESLRSPVYSTGYGLVMHALKKSNLLSIYSVDGSAAKRILSRMKSWVSDFF